MPICNGCALDQETTEEHLVHTEILRVIAGDASLRRRDRNVVLDGYNRYVGKFGEQEETGFNVNQVVGGLLCAKCNNGWANNLERKVATHLGEVLLQGEAMKSILLRRWAVFYGLKAWWVSGGSQDVLHQGHFTVWLVPISREGCAVEWPIRVARVPDYPYLSQVAYAPLDVPGWVMWTTRSLLWWLPIPAQGDVPLTVWPAKTAELTEGVRLADLPEMSKAEFAAFLPV